MPKINVLIFPAGEINSIELHDALSTCVNVEVFGASSIDRHGEYVFKNYISGLPMIFEPNFLEKINALITEKHIDLIFPTHDTIAEFFAENQEKINAKIIVADKNTSEICRDKLKTYEIFKNEDFCPKNYNDFSQLPVFIKPKKGQGTKDAKLINTKTDIPQDINIKDFVICEYLSGEEYTVDCITDKNGKVYAFPRSRERIFAGVSVCGKNQELTDEIKNIAEKINSKLKFRGLWYFQIKKDDNNRFKLLEISTRCPGSMCLTRALGVNLPLLSVYDAMEYDIEILPNKYDVKMDRTLISRYKINYEYDTVYFDFDDTLIINDKVYLPAISFLYQCKNENKKIILITRHLNDLDETLKKYLISKEIFDKIYHIDFGKPKVDYINPQKAIFIDNSAKERALVKKRYNIPTFDVDMLEVLTNWEK